MAYYRNKAYNNSIQKVRINLGTIFGEEKDEDAFIVLKELPTLETMELNSAHDKGQIELLQFFKQVLPKVIVDHNFYEDEQKKMTNDALIDLIYEKLDATSKVISEYTEAVFPSQAKKKEEK